jgi:hypothetical protein
MSWLIAAVACLPCGFAMAQATGVRPLGGVVLAALAAYAVIGSPAPPRRGAAWAVVVVACFAASHALADPLGTWGAVALVTLVAGGSAVPLLSDRTVRPPGSAPTWP